MERDDLIGSPHVTERILRLAGRMPEVAPGKLAELQTRLQASHQVPREAELSADLAEAGARRDTRRADPPTSHRRLLGPSLVLAKRVFRLVSQPFINELLRKQVEYNEAIFAVAVRLERHVRQQAEDQQEWREEVRRRLEALERPEPK